jgi:hypothetical protein
LFTTYGRIFPAITVIVVSLNGFLVGTWLCVSFLGLTLAGIFLWSVSGSRVLADAAVVYYINLLATQIDYPALGVRPAIAILLSGTGRCGIAARGINPRINGIAFRCRSTGCGSIHIACSDSAINITF